MAATARWTMVAGMLALGGAGAAQEVSIATGDSGLTYAPVGAIMAEAISEATGLSVTAAPSRGSLDNVEALDEGRHATALVQSDVAAWAHEGIGPWSGRPPVAGLRTIAALYPEHMHLVTLAGSGIASVADLRGRRVSLDEVGSGTHVEARLVLEAAGLRSDEYAASDMSGGAAAAALEEGEIDAFFIVAGIPTRTVAELAARVPVRLVPVDGLVASDLFARHGFIEGSTIPEGTYAGVGDTDTVSVGAHWFAMESLPDDVAYRLAEGLFAPETLRRLREGHPRGASITPGTALDGVAVPLHPGALDFYEASGMLD